MVPDSTEFAWRGDFAAARNRTHLHCHCGSWILYIDADERVTAGGTQRARFAARQSAAGSVHQMRFRPITGFTPLSRKVPPLS